MLAGFAAVLAVPVVADANTVSISGSMEGSIQISNGDWVSGGYAFSVQGSHPAMTVYMKNASIVFQGKCSNGSNDNTLTVPLSAGPYSIPANDNSTYPSGDEASDTSFQGSVQASVCGGSGQLDASSGASFSADLQSNVTTNSLNVQFHYRDPNAKGKGNYDCTASNYAADVCGASWSGTAHLTPSSISTTTSTSSTCTTSSSTTTTNSCTTSTTSSNTCASTPGPAGGTCTTTTSSTVSTTSSTVSNTTTTATVKATRTGRHKCAKGKVRKHGKCVAKKHKKISRRPTGTGHGFTG